MSGEPRSSDEVLILFKEALHKRRLYLRRRMEEIDQAEKVSNDQRKEEGKSNRGRTSDNYKSSRALRGGMLSEIATITGMLDAIESGKMHPDEMYNPEDDPKDTF